MIIELVMYLEKYIGPLKNIDLEESSREFTIEMKHSKLDREKIIGILDNNFFLYGVVDDTEELVCIFEIMPIDIKSVIEEIKILKKL